MQMPTMSRARRSPSNSYSLVLPTTSAKTMATSISLPIRRPLYLIWRGSLNGLGSDPSIHDRKRRIKRLGHGPRPRRDLRQEAPPGPCPLASGHQSVHVPRDRVQADTAPRAHLGVGNDAFDDL